jgi:hypothetical protein
MMGAGALAAVSVIAAGLVRFPLAAAEAEPQAVPVTAASVPVTAASGATRDKPAVRIIRLKPGQKAPKGARVIREAAPTPKVVVRRVNSAASSRTPQRVARTRQSGG